MNDRQIQQIQDRIRELADREDAIDYKAEHEEDEDRELEYRAECDVLRAQIDILQWVLSDVAGVTPWVVEHPLYIPPKARAGVNGN
jgi:hypothetical protein